MQTLASLLLLLVASHAHAAPEVGRRLLSRPDGRQPWKNAPPGNMTVVIHFNQLGQLAIRQTSTGLQLAAKYLALVAQAQRTVAQRYRRPDMQVAAAAYAGHAVLTRLFPLLSVNFDAVMRDYTDGLTPVQLNQVSQQGINIAQKLVAQSLTDGLAEWADWYTPPVGPQPAGVYAFTPGQTFALLPQLARTRPLVIPRPDPFEQGGPNPAASPAFAADLAEVRDVGQKGFAEPQDVTTAQFWFNGPGTASSAGQWSDVAMSLLPVNTTTFAAADLLYRLNAAMFDASIVCWYTKYKTNFWRPITAIRATIGPDTWEPVLNTPSHPEHPSGHSCAGGAAGQILTNFFGTSDLDITVGSEWPIWSAPTLPKRTYSSLWDAVQEGMDSRVYAGVHYRRAVNVGKAIGVKVAQFVWNAGAPAATVDYEDR
ncbi:hypothetical protein D9Q98_002410 [Chlorella vulgaris]|uniref:Phosphatidic acid phosphatase type 2/haloperoxidase domain-containing protein n=1 Tax=Chlorella vulgaris TaxID=3077 RepID=A0A9D4TXH9_CHLVU|nr:hypothetical protein D9Q98_002410 [Chlorella vulgaris]